MSGLSIDHFRNISFYFLLCLFCASGLPQALTSSAKFYRLHYMDDKVITSTTTLVGTLAYPISKSKCAAACLAAENCSSYFFLAGELCQLHSVLYLGADEALVKTGTTYWQLSQDACPFPSGYILYRPLRLCYKYVFTQVWWTTANATCFSQGTTLLKVNDSVTFDHMYNFLRGSSATRLLHVSIGANKDTGTWQWLDGSAVMWFNWASGEPSNSNEKCLTMAWFYYFKWNDVPCSSDSNAIYSFICQKYI